MAVRAAQVDVGQAATPVFTAGVAAARVTVTNQGDASVFLGPSGVTVLNGYELEQDGSVELAVSPGDVLFGIAASGPQTVHVLAS